MKKSSSRSFSSDTEKNLEDCRAINLRSGKELGKSKNAENGKDENENMVDEEVANKRVEGEEVETKKQESLVDKEEKREENKSTP